MCCKMETNSILDMKRKKKSNIFKSKKFFLDIKNHTVLTKYETKLSSLGAVISPFLDKEVNYVLTDTPGCNGKASVAARESSSVLSPSCYSVSPATPASGDESTLIKKTRTRAEAMLERVPVQAQVVSYNPIADAVSWKIPVYSIDYFQKWLDKKLAHIQLVNEKNEVKCEASVRVFGKKYLKLESVVINKFRPEFKEVSKWPHLDANTVAGSCPFDKKYFKRIAKKEKNNANKKKESERMNRTCNKTANESGYCEICAVHYSDLSQHEASSSHLKFVCNEKNYSDLDNCIKTRSVEAFLAAHNSSNTNSQSKEVNSTEPMGRNLRKTISLHLNNNENSAVTRSLSNAKLLADESLQQPLQVQCNGFTNYHLRKTSNKSDSALIKSPGYYGSKDLLRESRKVYASCPESTGNHTKDHSQLSPIKEGNNVHRLRSRKSLFLPSILIGTTAEDGPNKSRAGMLPQTPILNHILRSSISPKSQNANHSATRSRLPSSQEDECKKYNASPSSGLPKGEPSVNANSIYFTRSKFTNNSGSPGECDGKKNSNSSESAAEESRAGGHKANRRRLSTAVSEEEDRRESCKFIRASVSPRNVPSYHYSKKTFKNNLCSDNSDHGSDKSQKKRLSVEEKFLEDNREYYKVEMLRTKLRSTEFYCNQEINHTGTKADDMTMEQPPQDDEDDDDDEDEEEKVVMRFKKIRQRRQSALQLLNLEAENFLYGPPKKDDEENTSRESNDDDEGDETEYDEKDDEDNGKARGKDNEEHSREKISLNSSSGSSSKQADKTKKRRTHAEVFIHDNLDYYGFEISGSRLRQHQNSESTDSSMKGDSEPKSGSKQTSRRSSVRASSPTFGTVKIKEEMMTDDEFEAAAKRRRDRPGENEVIIKRRRSKKQRSKGSEGEKKPASIASEVDQIGDSQTSNDATSVDTKEMCFVRSTPPQQINFSFESIPSAEPWYKTFQRLDTCNEFYIPIPNTYISKIKSPPRNNTRQSAQGSPGGRRRKLSRFTRLVEEDKPRKSPRCHASTLAILSSLTNHRRRSKKLLTANLKQNQSTSRATPKPEPVVKPAVAAINLSLEHEAKLKQEYKALAKDADERFIELFGEEDCGDRYLETLKVREQQNTDEDVKPVIAGTEQPHYCMQFDEGILHDEELLNCFSGSSELIGDMATFIENAQRCNSMESAIDEEWMIPRSNDVLSRLCRENDYSCNSSDCGASSTCEFLGFAEDGRTVSRRRKRKRPNMTGWPHDNKRKRRNIRFSEANHNNDVAGNGAAGDTEADAGAAASVPNSNDTASEADTDCSDDDMPLSQIIARKKRRKNSCTANTSGATPNQARSEGSSSRVSLRRSSKSGGFANSLPCTRRVSQSQRNSKCSVSHPVRRSRN